MPKITAAELKELFDVVAEIKLVRLDFCISAAERTLRNWVTNPVYNAIEPAEQFEALKFAEANLAVYHLLLNTGLRIRRSGLIKREQDAGGSVTNNVVNEFYGIAEINQLRQTFYEEAKSVIAEVLPKKPFPKSTTVIIKGGYSDIDE